MKKNNTLFMMIFIFLVALLFQGCDKDEVDKSNRILLLQVDYVTNVFEGGKELKISNNFTSSDTIPIVVDYKAPGDFGNITLYYEPTNEMIFDGSIIWMGTGEIKFPNEFLTADEFPLMDTFLEEPELTKFQTIFFNLNNQSINYNAIWSSINKLGIVDEYLKSDKKIGLFLYTPSVGVGDPNEWDWFVILYK